MRRIERLINLIAALLDTDRPLTAEEIRERIAGYDQSTADAFKRAFERDKEHLRAMGIPLETVFSGRDPLADQPAAYIIPKERYYLPELDLEPDELAALRLAGDVILGAGDLAEQGLLKLSVDEGGSPESGPRVPWGADVAAEQPLLGSLYGALVERDAVRFTYAPASGDAAERTVESYALIHRKGHWYLVGRDIDRAAPRVFKLSRFGSSIARTGIAYDIPEGFDAGAQLTGEAFEIGAQDGGFRATVRVSSRMRWWVEQNMAAAASRAAPDGAIELDLPVANLDALISWALGFGPEVVILRPQEARAAMLQRLAVWTGGTR